MSDKVEIVIRVASPITETLAAMVGLYRGVITDEEYDERSEELERIYRDVLLSD